MISKILLILSLSFFAGIYASQQCVTVKGRVECPNRSTPVLIRLVDIDAGGPDDPMKDGCAMRTGSFELHGCASDPVGSIDPVVKIYHKCMGSPKVFDLTVPADKIGGRHDFGTINLGGQHRGEHAPTSAHETQMTSCALIGGRGNRRVRLFIEEDDD